MNERTTFTRGRRLAIGLNVLVASLLAPLVAGLLLYLCFRPELRRRVDLTARSAFTLSDRTLAVLDRMVGPVDVYSCFRPIPVNDAGQPAPGMEAVIQTIGLHCNDLLREFEVRARGKLRVHPYDPNFTGHVARITDLGALIGEPAINVVVAVCGSKRRVLRLPDLAAYDAGTQATQAMTRPTLNGFRDEESLVQAILSVTEERQRKVAFLRGHGERDPAAQGVDASGRPGMSRWATALMAQNYLLNSIDLTEAKELTKETVDLLVIADPVKPLAASEVDVIVRYAKAGGKLVVMLGPTAANSLDFPLLNETFGLERTPHPVCQVTTIGNFTSDANVFWTDRSYAEHPIVKPLKNRQLRMFWQDAGAITPLGRAEQTDVMAAPLVWSGSDAWVDLPGASRKYNRQFDPGVEEKKGPYVLADAVQRKEGGRAVVIGSGDVLDDETLFRAASNRDFGLNLVDWLAEREQLISIGYKPFEVINVDLTAKEFGTIFLYVVVGVPLVALLLGVAVFWLRRN